MLDDLSTPAGVSYNGSTPAGRSKEDGGLIEICKFTYEYIDVFGVKHEQITFIPRDSSMSRAHVEDMAAQGRENFIIECREKYSKRKPNAQERKDLANILKDFRETAQRRATSTNNKLYYPV